MPKVKNISIDEYYHVFNRGMQKQPIFETDKDRLRFLYLLMLFQSQETMRNVGRELKYMTQKGRLEIPLTIAKSVVEKRMVELVGFCLMSNHFHLLIKEKIEGGISKYMQRVIIAYTKYFNIRYNKTGHLMQGSYQSVLVENDTHLMHLSAYIHRNPLEIREWKDKKEKYPWSSLQDYIITNRWGNLLSTGIILDRYEPGAEKRGYRDFVDSSLTKELIGETPKGL